MYKRAPNRVYDLFCPKTFVLWLFTRWNNRKGLTAMAFVPTPDTALASVSYMSNDGILAQNNFWCALTDPPTTEGLTEIGDALHDALQANWTEIAHNAWSIIGIRVRAMNEEEGLVVVDANTYPIPGLADDDVDTPGQASYTITLNTGLVGKSARGRIYGVGLPSGFQDGFRLIPTGQALMQAKWNLIHSAMETAGHALQVVSFVEDGIPRAAGRPLPVLSVSVRFPLATQRRRLS